MIEVKNLSFSYTTKDPAVKNVSFTVKDHEWLSIIGHNGSGKSTMAKLLVGLLQPNSGTISYDGTILDEKSLPIVRNKVGIVFQNPDNQFVGYNVLYDIAFGLENRQIPRSEMMDLIHKYTKLVDMEEYLDREPETLSGGQKQRVAISRMLLLDKEVLLFDDSLSAVDTKTDLDIRNALKEHNKKLTSIIITHRITTAKECDKIIVIENGKVSAIGTHNELAKLPGLYKDLWDIQGALEDEFIEIAKSATRSKKYV